MTRSEVAEILEEIGTLLELKGENPFKVRAYQAAARAVETLETDLEELVRNDELGKVPGIGKALVEKITALVETGRLKFHEDLKASIPPGLIEMLEIPGVGPKKIKLLNDRLGIETIVQLAEACQEGRVAGLPGMGAKSQQKILDGIRNREAYARRHLWWNARAIADPILEGLRALPEVDRAEHAGSLRRGLETVGDLDFIVASGKPGPVMEWFTAMPGVAEVTAKGETKSSVRLAGGMQADIRVVPAEQFVFTLHHFTGSKNHNVLMRQRALARGYSLSEWGLFAKEEVADADGKPSGRAPVTHPQSEDDLFRFLELHYIPPELREGGDELEAAEAGPLPRLLELNDIRGVFHNHTTASDGRNSLREMAAAAAALEWEYLGIADHSKASFQANGLSEEKLLAQVKEIRKFNASGQCPTHLFAGVECDILPDGSLDFGPDVLRELDYTVVSVHSAFSQSEDEMTRRIVRAIEHPGVTMLGHLTGRLLLMREAYSVDARKVIDAAAANGVMIEINANPRRLDMDWRHWKRAAERGVLAVINPDAHSTDNLDYCRAGVVVARKGWLRKEDVFNTRTLREVQKSFERKKG